MWTRGALAALKRYCPIAVAVPALALAVPVLAIGISGSALERGDAGIAYRLWPFSSQAAVANAQQALFRGALDDAEQGAEIALKLSAQQISGLKVLAAVAELRGDWQTRDEALVLAAQQGWRDSAIQLRLLGRALEVEDFRSAALAADALLRTGNNTDTAERALRQLVGSEEGRAAFLERLVEEPPWEARFFRLMRVRDEEDAANLGSLLIAASKAGVRPSDDAVRPFFSDLLSKQMVDEALVIWRGVTANPGADPRQGTVDGGFDVLSASSEDGWGPFGWRMRNTRRVMVTNVWRNNVSADPVMQIATASRQAETALQQNVMLAPGRWFLQYEASQKGGQQGAFRWQMRCQESGEELFRGPVGAAIANEWNEREAAFTVPSSGCPTQVLILRAGSTSGRSVILIDNVEISRLPSDSTPLPVLR